jgi:hypothetical protein
MDDGENEIWSMWKIVPVQGRGERSRGHCHDTVFVTAGTSCADLRTL